MATQKKQSGGQDVALQELYRQSHSLLRLSKALEQAQTYSEVLESTRQEMLDSGMDDFVSKPYIWMEDFSAINRLIDHPAMDSSPAHCLFGFGER